MNNKIPQMKPSLNDMLLNKDVRKSFIQLISRHYPLTEEELTTYGSALSWRGISENQNIIWTENMVFEHLYKLDSFHFYHYARLPWSHSFIDKIIASKHAGWKHFMQNRYLLEQPNLFSYSLPHWNNLDTWNFPERRFTRKTIMGAENPEVYENIIQMSNTFNWNKWSAVDTFFWREEFIAANEEKWNWNLLSGNVSLPWSETFINKFKKQWNWSKLSKNKAVPWSTSILQQFKDDIDWSVLCVFIPVSYQLVKQFEEYWDWSHLNTILISDVHAYGDYVMSFYETYQFPTYQEGDLNKIVIKYAKNIIWFEFYEEYMLGATLKGGILLSINWDMALFSKVEDVIDKQYEAAVIENKSELTGSQYTEKHLTYFLSYTFLNKNLFEYLKALEHQKGISCINWNAISLNSQLVADDDFLSGHFTLLTTALLVKNEWFDWDRDFQKIRDELTKTDWEFISKHKKMDNHLITKYRTELHWSSLAHNPHLTMTIIDNFEKEWSAIDWYWLSAHPAVSIKAINEKQPWRWDGLLRYGVGLTEHLDQDLIHLFLTEVLTTEKG